MTESYTPYKTLNSPSYSSAARPTHRHAHPVRHPQPPPRQKLVPQRLQTTVRHPSPSLVLPAAPSTQHHHRLALNYKSIPYRTEWVEYPQIESLAQRLGVKPTSLKADRVMPEYTLPIIHDESTGVSIANSLPIALYLEETYPGSPRLFPEGSKALRAAWDGRGRKRFVRGG